MYKENKYTEKFLAIHCLYISVIFFRYCIIVILKTITFRNKWFTMAMFWIDQRITKNAKIYKEFYIIYTIPSGYSYIENI